MSNKQAYKNAPTSQLAKLEGTGYCSQTLTKLLAVSELAKNGKPQSVDELADRIQAYFRVCVENDLRVGIENLCLSLGIDRQTFWNWCNGKYRTDEPLWGELCRQARQMVVSALETASQEGRINPASSIFFLKNWACYTDSLQIEAKPIEEERKLISVADLPKLEEIAEKINSNNNADVFSIADLPNLNNGD